MAMNILKTSKINIEKVQTKNIYRELDLQSWNRKDQYEFFKDYDNPFFNIVANINVTRLYEFCKKKNISFFLSSLFCSCKAANAVEEFRYRIKDDKIIVYDTIHAGSTILHSDNTFGFCYFDYFEDHRKFAAHAQKEIEQLRKTKKLEPRVDADNLIHYSVIPWISFTSFQHARNLGTQDTIPKIVFGKHFQEGAVKKMPVSVEVNHALLDGYHVGQYFERLQQTVDTVA